ncbi:MAG: sodium:solute symporter family protein [Clostridia bacterium]|nr:sodium:solute symporter family protein [Clostridia bacterium]
MVLDIMVLLLFIASMVFIAVYTRKKANTADDFLLAGKKGVNGWMSAFSYGTTYFSAVIFIGYAGKFGWNFGLSAIWIGVGNAFIGGLLAWMLLAKRTKNMTNRLSAKTMPDFFEKRYNSPFLKKISAILIFVMLIPYAASVYNGLGNLFQAMFGFNETQGLFVIVGLALLTALYLVFGGYFATSLSDFVQGIIMLLGVAVMVIFFMINDKVQGFAGLNELSSNGFGLFPAYGDKGFLSSPLIVLISLILLTSVGVYGLPQTVHKYYAVRDKKAIMQGTVVSTIFAFIVGVSAYFIGSLGHLFYTEVQTIGGTDNIVPQMLNKVIPSGFKGLIAVLVLSASMSTLASVALASSSVLSIDLYKGSINKNASDKAVTLTMRITCIVFVILSVAIAILNKKYQISAIAYLMGLSWGTLSGCFFGPFVLGLYNKKLTKAGAISSVIGGIVLTAVLIVVFGGITAGFDSGFGAILKNGVNNSPIIGVICMAFSIIITIVVSLFTQKPDDKVIENAFDKKIENVIE